ncbi:glycosyltransferase [Kosakonia sacchari]|uniref:Glycosyltransferase involved in cell wall bisynthesis n=1 Tax=Kosakonia sacchari TaxID=1158459 RepID=A0A1G4YGG5_9ENTR|nr:glycosyltransferase [Kosakonia sacchari]AHJ73333.1 hypothetical protein C813_00025 [Kosakonia sacchari SP1]SCX52444.1 Glycosyltransferase involved in cell wall bisynthesis [Kosakonia sacchari]
MEPVYISIPRFALSGGNLVTLSLAKYLSSQGIDVYCCSGFKIKRPNDVTLLKPQRGKLNSFLNLVSFLFLSIHALIVKNYVASHHLTCILNFIKKSRFALVQDIECDFYPQKLRWIGKRLWSNYLSSENLIFTNPHLAYKIGIKSNVQGFSYIPIELPTTFASNQLRNHDVVAVIRDGEYKAPQKTLDVLIELAKRGWNVIAINGTRHDYQYPFIINNLDRDEFIKILSNAKLFLCLSKWEGLGLPNLEAYVCGCDIVSTPIPSGCLLSDLDFESVEIVDSDCSAKLVSDIISTRLSTNGNLRKNNDDAEFLLQRKDSFLEINNTWLCYAKDMIQGFAK